MKIVAFVATKQHIFLPRYSLKFLVTLKDALLWKRKVLTDLCGPPTPPHTPGLDVHQEAVWPLGLGLSVHPDYEVGVRRCKDKQEQQWPGVRRGPEGHRGGHRAWSQGKGALARCGSLHRPSPPAPGKLSTDRTAIDQEPAHHRGTGKDQVMDKTCRQQP